MENKNGELVFTVNKDQFDDITECYVDYGSRFAGKELDMTQIRFLATNTILNSLVQPLDIDDGCTIQVQLGQNTNDFPFELLMSEKGTLLGESRVITRIPRSHNPRTDLRRNLKQMGFVHTTNPVPDMFNHEFERTAFENWFDDISIATYEHLGPDPLERARFIIGNCQIVHFAGHNNQGTTQFQLDGTNNMYLTPSDLSSIDHFPEFVWMNTCHSAGATDNDSWAQYFLKKGCRCFIGSSINISDAFAFDAADDFYKHISSGETTGYAYMRMIKSFKNRQFFDQFKLRFYGDHKLILKTYKQ